MERYKTPKIVKYSARTLLIELLIDLAALAILGPIKIVMSVLLLIAVYALILIFGYMLFIVGNPKIEIV